MGGEFKSAEQKPTETGGPAFPTPESAWFQGVPSGMTLRDYLAGRAMQAMITKSSGQDTTGGKKGVPLIAKYAYEFADAMLAERSRKP